MHAIFKYHYFYALLLLMYKEYWNVRLFLQYTYARYLKQIYTPGGVLNQCSGLNVKAVNSIFV